MISCEQMTIGGLIQEPSRITEIDLLPDDFSDEHGKGLFQGVLDLIAQNNPIDLFILAKHFNQEENQAWIVNIGRMLKISCASNVKTYAEMVKDSSNHRKTLEIAEALKQNAQDKNSVDAAIRDLMALNITRRSFEYSMPQVIGKSYEVMDQACEGITGISTGNPDIDNSLGGFQDTCLYVIGGRPAMGKTAFMLNLSDRCNVPCGIISVEQGHEQLGQRMLAIDGRVSVHKMRRGRLDGNDWENITKSLARLSDRLTWVNDNPAITIEGIIRQARKWKHQHGIQILFVDYIQRIKTTEKLSIRERVGEIARCLKELARELEIPVIALSQLSRECEKRNDKRPYMSDLKEAGEIEQESDTIMLLYRDEVYHPNTNDKGIAEVSIVKNRHGPTGLIRCTWIGKYMRFEPYQ